MITLHQHHLHEPRKCRTRFTTTSTLQRERALIYRLAWPVYQELLTCLILTRTPEDLRTNTDILPLLNTSIHRDIATLSAWAHKVGSWQLRGQYKGAVCPTSSPSSPTLSNAPSSMEIQHENTLKLVTTTNKLASRLLSKYFLLFDSSPTPFLPHHNHSPQPTTVHCQGPSFCRV